MEQQAFGLNDRVVIKESLGMKVLVLAGGFPQIALIKELKKRDYTVILADWNENPVAKGYADIYYQVSTLDIDAITEIAKKENVCFLITACTDQALLTVAKVSEVLGLPCYIDYQTALNVTNKAYMKKVFVENGIPTAQHVIVDTMSQVPTEMQFPLIVKPVDCNSSKGVKKVTGREELGIAIKHAVDYSRTHTAIVEQYIAGVEISVDVYVENGKAHILCVSNNDKIADKDKFIIFRGRCPAEGVEAVRDKIERAAQKIADAFQLVNSPMLIQLLTDGKEIYVLEFSARTGGGTKFLRIKNVSGFDVIKAVVDLTEGKYPHVEPFGGNKYIADEFIYCKPGQFDRLEGFDELLEQGVISDFYTFKWRGASFDKVECSGDRVGGFTIVADTYDQLREKHRIVADRIRVIGMDGADIMRHDLLTDL